MLSNFFGAAKSRSPTDLDKFSLSKASKIGTQVASDTMEPLQQATADTMTASVEQKHAIAETSGVLQNVEVDDSSAQNNHNYPLTGIDQHALSDADKNSSDGHSPIITKPVCQPIQEGSKDCTPESVPTESSSDESLINDTKMEVDEFDVGNIGESSTGQLVLVQQSSITTPAPLLNTGGFVSGSSGSMSQDVDMTGAARNTDLSRYRPIAELPPLRGRTCNTPPPSGSGWSISPTWPPPKPYRGMPPVRPDVVPPEGSPLHVHIQAYALRWGTWAAQLKDDALQEKLLKWVTDKMREAWETAIKEGYYPRPDGVLVQADHARSGSDGQTKQRGRKRAQSLSKQPAPFSHEGKDPLAVTNGELATVGVTMEMINDRVDAKDFEAGELLLDEVLVNIGKDKIEVKDWTRAYKPSVPGRNLLMYSLYAVQEARNEVQKLRRLYLHFTKDIQRKNTQVRIDNYQERANQYLALATEIQLSRLENGGSDAGTQEGDVEEVQQVDVTSDSSSVEVVDEEEQLAEDAPGQDKGPILEIATDILHATNENAMIASFTSRELQAEDFSSEAGQDDHDPKTKEARLLLGQIHSFLTQIAQVRQAMSRTHLPGDKIKFGHDARLMKEKIGIAQGKLKVLLAAELGLQVQPSPIPRSLHSSGTHYSNGLPANGFAANTTSPLQPTPSTSVQNEPPPLNAEMKPASAIAPQPVQPPAPTPELQSKVTNTAAHNKMPSPPAVSSAKQEKGTSPEAAAEEKVEESTAKQVYVDQRYRPWLNQMLATRQLPSIQGSLSGWQDIKGYLTQLNYSSKDRNVELRNFKAGFDEWYVKNKGSFFGGIDRQSFESQVLVSTPASSTKTSPRQVQAPATTTMTSPPQIRTRMSNYAELGRPLDAEILAAIPPTGIHGSILSNMFIGRFGGDYAGLGETIKRIAFLDVDKMIYPPRNQPMEPYRQTQSKQQPVMAMHRQNLMSNSTQFSQYHVTPPPAMLSQPTVQNPSMMMPPLRTPTLMNNAWSIPTPSPLSASTHVPTFPHQTVTLKLNQPSAPAPPPQNESTMANEYSSHEVNSSRGFTFRHLPNATLEQRKRMDDHINEYIAQTIKSRKRRYGQYITFTDSEDSQSQPVMHGIWDLDNKGNRPTNIDWFYSGEDMPSGWSVEDVGGYGHDQDDDQDFTASSQQQKRLKLRLNFNPQSQQVQQDYVEHMQSEGVGVTAKKGTKRARNNTGAQGGRKKKRRNAGGDDDEDDGDYDPGED